MPTILLIHGVQSSSSTWWRAADDLTDLGWQVHLVNLLGHGGRRVEQPLSVADLALDVAGTAGTDEVDLVVGHSLGAIVALSLCAQLPRLARGVIAEDPPGLGNAPTAGFVADRVAEAARRAIADPDGEQAKVLQQNPLWSAIDAQHAIASRQALDVEGVTAFLRANRWDTPQLVADCPVPVQLLLADGPATALGEPDRSTARSALPADRVRVVVSGHSVHRDRPALWLDTVSRFAQAIGCQPSGS